MKLINIFVILILSNALSYSQVTATQPPNFEICDEVPFDGLAVFDLEIQTAIILDAQNPVNWLRVTSNQMLIHCRQVRYLFWPHHVHGWCGRDGRDFLQWRSR